MKKIVEKAKANPALVTILTLLIGSGGTAGVNYDRVMGFLNAPARIQRMEARQILLMKTMFESGHFKDDPMAMFNLMYPSQRVVDSIMGGE